MGNVRAEKNNGHVGVILKNSKNMVIKLRFWTIFLEFFNHLSQRQPYISSNILNKT